MTPEVAAWLVGLLEGTVRGSMLTLVVLSPVIVARVAAYVRDR